MRRCLLLQQNTAGAAIVVPTSTPDYIVAITATLHAGFTAETASDCLLPDEIACHDASFHSKHVGSSAYTEYTGEK